MPIARMSRRRFCGLGVSAALVVSPTATLAQAEAEPDQPLPVIDTHQHLWDLRKFELPWLADYETLRRSYLLTDYWDAARGTGIVKTIYMEVDVTPKQRQAEVDYVMALAKQPANRMAGAVVGGSPESPQFSDYVRELKSNGIVKGVRAAMRSRKSAEEFELDRDFVVGVRLLGENDLSYDINVSPEQLPLAAALIDQAPDTRFVLDHCGNIAPVAPAKADVERWKRGMAEVAKRKHVVCKVSGFISNSKGKSPSIEEIAMVVDHVYECFGPDRVMFAGDWPVCTLAMSLAEWVTILQQIASERPRADQKKLFHDNAARFYGV